MGTRVYKYGLVPIGYQPKETIEELYRANKLWNALVQINRKNLANGTMHDVVFQRNTEVN